MKLKIGCAQKLLHNLRKIYAFKYFYETPLDFGKINITVCVSCVHYADNIFLTSKLGTQIKPMNFTCFDLLDARFVFLHKFQLCVFSEHTEAFLFFLIFFSLIQLFISCFYYIACFYLTLEIINREFWIRILIYHQQRITVNLEIFKAMNI